jgi:hypothetical protein
LDGPSACHGQHERRELGERQTKKREDCHFALGIGRVEAHYDHNAHPPETDHQTGDPVRPLLRYETNV